ncbi:GLPGLI family protein [Myroides pelagicus]|uniref:GLPGLI family protein n=1 Tax=Myroides pelagicus TaxID=270914 RepID=A0A7K1GLR7_9FLAO|nr:GLPGLI family protein [Myroides pelagicus]MEC4113116.1 GLPGLI family protein [Myroides pelagicus]MTH29835.1 GLPGLI family protein [Myroides pelagicus]
MKYITILFLAFTSICFSQKTNIAYYKVKYLFNDENLENSSPYSSYLSKAKDYEEAVELKLLFNKERASFEMSTNNRNSQNKLAFSLCGCDKTIYSNVTNKTIKYYNKGSAPMNILENRYLLVNTLFADWTLDNEQLKINGFTAYKATRTKIDVKGKPILVTAWYAPEFPYPFGPLTYSGLPGLIIQVQENNKMFTLSKIEFNKDITIEQEPTKGEVLSEEDFNKLQYQTYLNMSRKN